MLDRMNEGRDQKKGRQIQTEPSLCPELGGQERGGRLSSIENRSPNSFSELNQPADGAPTAFAAAQMRR